jgi:hypothetical protein
MMPTHHIGAWHRRKIDVLIHKKRSNKRITFCRVLITLQIYNIKRPLSIVLPENLPYLPHLPHIFHEIMHDFIRVVEDGRCGRCFLKKYYYLCRW